MMDRVKKLLPFKRRDLKYLYLKNLKPEKYEGFLKKEYKNRTGEKLNLETPTKYTEKMQYNKIYLATPLKTKLADKYKAREWVSEKIGSQYLIPLLNVWDRYEEIDFGTLPQKFVLKTNHAAGWNLIVEDKSKIDHECEKKRFDSWQKKNFAFYTDLQLQYRDIERKIVAEEFIQDSKGLLPEYKFFCFDGEVHYCWEIVGRGSEEYRNVYDLDWNLQPWKFQGHDNSPYQTRKPANFDEMIKLAEILSQDFSHVRVDLYNVDGQIYFGEMTFTSTGGYRLIEPEQYNYLLGSLWDLEK